MVVIIYRVNILKPGKNNFPTFLVAFPLFPTFFPLFKMVVNRGLVTFWPSKSITTPYIFPLSHFFYGEGKKGGCGWLGGWPFENGNF